MRQRAQGVVFDLDETLLDRRASLDLYARRLHCAFDSRAFISLDAFVSEIHRLDGNGQTSRVLFFERVASLLLPGVSAEEVRRHFESHAWRSPKLFPGVADMLRALDAQDLRLGIVTNGGEASQMAKITNSGLSDLVECCVVSETFGARKPDRSIFEHMTVRLGIDPLESWFVGDDPRCDIWGAKQCGYRTAWVARKATWPVDLPPCFDAQLYSILELQGLLAA